MLKVKDNKTLRKRQAIRAMQRILTQESVFAKEQQICLKPSPR